jgi:hypothetical protein
MGPPRRTPAPPPGLNGPTPPRIHLPRQAAPCTAGVVTHGCSRVLTGYSRVLTGTHGYSRVLTGTHGYSRVLTGTHRVLTRVPPACRASPSAACCRRLARGYLFGFCLASGRAVWQHNDAYAPKRSPQAGPFRALALSGNGRGYAGVGLSLCVGLLAWRPQVCVAGARLWVSARRRRLRRRRAHGRLCAAVRASVGHGHPASETARVPRSSSSSREHPVSEHARCGCGCAELAAETS